MALDFQKLNELAMNYDPFPILRDMSTVGVAGGGIGMQTPATPYADMIGGGGQFQTPPGIAQSGTTPPPPAGMDPRLMQQLMQGTQTPAAAPHFIGGAMPQRPPIINMAAMPMPAAPPAAGVDIPSLAALIQGGAYRR